MANDAHIAFVGTVLQNPTKRQVNNSNVVTLKVAVQTTKKQENSQYPASDIYDVSVWGNPGEGLMNRVGPKSKVFVTGAFMMGNHYTDKNGNPQTNLRVENATVKIISGTTNNNNNNNNQSSGSFEEDPF